MKKLRILLLALLVFVFAFQSMACNTPQEEAYEAPHMNDRVYERIDEEALNALVEKIYSLVEEDGNRYYLKQAREEFFTDYYTKAFTMNTLASINFDKNTRDEYWEEESVWALTFAQNIQNIALEVEKAIFGSEYYGEYFTRIYGEDYAESILVSELQTEEQLALQAEIASLESAYNSLYSTGSYNAIIDLYIELVNLRNKYAATYTDAEGNPYKNYMDFAYENIYGREYTPDEVAEFRESLEKEFRPVRSLLEGINTAKDDELTEDRLKNYMPRIIQETAPEMLSSWKYMINKGLYDFRVAYRKAKTSYVTTFSEYNDAYMFLNASGKLKQDLSTVIHEFGHYNEKFMAKEELKDPSGVRSYDLAETHSQAFELITLPAVKKVLYSTYPTHDYYKAYAADLLYNSVWAILSNCIFDEFEYIVYNEPVENLNATFLNNTFKTCWNKYWPSSGGYKFYDIYHFFGASGYCISYTVSMIFSAEIWASDAPVENYLAVVEYGSYNYLSTVSDALGLPNPVSQETVSMVTSSLMTYINENLVS